jgi:hypothetical protein
MDEPGECRERQVRAINRMREQQRIARWGLDGPETIELDYKAIVVKNGVPAIWLGS